MKRFEYQQIDYNQYPSPEELNEEGDEGWEMICIDEITKKYFDTVLVSSYSKKIYRVTFKREIV
jgi:hypothetical protein